MKFDVAQIRRMKHPRHDCDTVGESTEDAVGTTLICFGGGHGLGPDHCRVSFQTGRPNQREASFELLIRWLLRPGGTVAV